MKIEIEWIICLIFIVICAVIDIRKKEIPVIVLALFGGCALFYAMIWGERAWVEILYSLMPGFFLLLLGLCTRESIGYGDGLAVMPVGMLIGWKGCIAAVVGGFLFSAGFVSRQKSEREKPHTFSSISDGWIGGALYCVEKSIRMQEAI